MIKGHLTKRSAFVYLVLSLISLSILGGLSTAWTNEAISQTKSGFSGNDKHFQALDKFRKDFASIETVHFLATAQISLNAGSEQITGEGQIEYWAQGNRYRINCKISDNLKKAGLVRNLDMAFDGNRFYFLDYQSEILSFGQQEPSYSILALPNPFFLPLDFISSDDDNCENCRLKLSDIKNPPAIWAERSKSITEISSATISGKKMSEIRMPGGKLQQKQYEFRIKLAGNTEENSYPKQIDKVALDGKKLVSLTFSDFTQPANNSLKIPKLISIDAFDESGKAAMKTVFTFREIEINQPIKESHFQISPSEAKQLWDSDRRKFVSEMSP